MKIRFDPFTEEIKSNADLHFSDYEKKKNEDNGKKKFWNIKDLTFQNNKLVFKFKNAFSRKKSKKYTCAHDLSELVDHMKNIQKMVD